MHMRVRAFGLGAHGLADLRAQLEQRFAVALLDACEREVHRQLGPEVLVFVRSVRQRSTLRLDQLDAQTAERLGERLAHDLIASVRTGHPPRPSDAAVMFTDRPRYRAAYLRARSSADALQAAAWYFARLREREPLLDAAHEGPDSVRRLLRALVELDALEALVAHAPAAVRATLVGVVAPSEWPVTARSRERIELWLNRSTASTIALDPNEAERAAAPDVLVSSHEQGRSPSDDPPPYPSAPEQVPSEGEREAGPASELRSGELASQRSNNRKLAQAATLAPAAAPADRLDNRVGDPAAPPHAPEPSPTEPAATDRSALPSMVAVPQASPRPSPGCATAWAGLFYLAARILELELGSHLWEAGVHEGPIIAALARHLAGVEVGDDPAPRVLGFGFSPVELSLEPIADWATVEIIDKLERSLAASLARRRLVAEPSPLRQAAEHLDGGERQWLSTLAPDHRTAGVLAAAGAALRTRMAAALEQPDDLAAVRPHLRVPGRIELAPGGAIEVHLAMGNVDLALRRAGLDFDPGWLPWLDAKLGFVFDPGRDESW